jgi:hypothetical protein
MRATLSKDGKLVDLGRFNFTWHDYMTGVIDHVVLFLFGFLFGLSIQYGSLNLEDYGISPASVPQMAASASIVTGLLLSNPREIGIEEIEQLYRRCFSALS